MGWPGLCEVSLHLQCENLDNQGGAGPAIERSVAGAFRQFGPTYEARMGYGMSVEQRKAMTAIVRCRTPALGGQVVECKDCLGQALVFHSCRHRSCPRCMREDVDEWLQLKQAELLPVPYFHLIFKVPQKLVSDARAPRSFARFGCATSRPRREYGAKEVEMARRRSALEWRGLVERFESSGLSGEVFARRNQLNPRTLLWWQSRIRCGHAKVSEEFRFVEVLPRAEVAPPALQGEPSPSRRAAVSVYARGVRVEVRPGFDPATLTAVLEALESRTRGGR